MNKSLLSTGHDDWNTPMEIFRELDELFHFTLDACTTPDNPLGCVNAFTPTENGLEQDWSGERVYCNPPYSRKNGGQDAWVKKCWEEGQKPGATVVALLPARTGTDRFHRYILGSARVRFWRGRICFDKPVEDGENKPPEDKEKTPAPFDSMVVVWGGPDVLPDEYLDFRHMTKLQEENTSLTTLNTEAMELLELAVGDLNEACDCEYCVNIEGCNLNQMDCESWLWQHAARYEALKAKEKDGDNRND